MKILLRILLPTAVIILFGGCHLVGVLGEESHSEKKIKAEYNLEKNMKGKILIIADTAAASGADVDIKDKDGYTALDHARNLNLTTISNLLKENGAE